MKKFLALFLSAALTLTFSGCTANKKTPVDTKPAQIRIANVIFPGGPPQGIVMLEKNFLKEKLGQETEIIPISTRNIDKVSKEMKEEAYDFIFCYYGTIAEYASKLSAWETGDNFQLIANLSNGPGNKIVAQPEFSDISQLDGKTIAVFNSDFANMMIAANTLKENGLDITARGGTVNVRMGNSVEIMNDFKAGKIEALMARPSFQEPGFNTLKAPNEMAYGGKPPYQILLARKAFVEKYPDTTAKVLEALIETTDWIKANRTETAEIVWTVSEKFYQENNMEALMPKKADMARAYDRMLADVYPNTRFIDDVWGYMETYNSVKPYPKSEIINLAPLQSVLKSKGMLSIEEYNSREYNN